MFKPCKGTNSEQGVALVMVLGLLTVMVLMAVTFAITMRTERLAAGNYADTVRARELVQVGLAQALNQLANDLGTNGLNSHLAGVEVGKVYPSWNVTNSFTNIPNTTLARWNTNIYLIKGEATNYVPRALWTEATNADNLSPSNHWLPVESLIYTNYISDKYLSESNLMGRVAYLILNCSGLLDANYAGSATVTRQGGTNPAEIAIGNLGEIITPTFLTKRATDVRYETMGELNALADINKPATNLFVYSRALPGYWSNNVIPSLSPQVVTQVNLSGDAISLSNRMTEITDALMNIGISSSDAFILWRNLVDYADPNSVPTYLLSTCVEAVPMINEIIFQCVSGPTPPLDNKTLSVYYELWFPFVAGGGTFSFNGQVKFGATTCATVVNDFLISPGFKLIGPFTTTTTDPGPFIPTIVNAEITYSGQKVDELAPNSILAVISIVNDAPSISLECLDPRFNKDPIDLAYWRLAASPTPDATNSWVTEWWQIHPDGDTDSEMYVRNNNLQSVAELGYLAYAPWKTVKLYGPNLHRVLDVFAIDNNSINDYVVVTNRGLVNPNSRQEDALAVVFAGMPIDQYSGDPAAAGITLTMNTAREVYSRLTNSHVFANGFTNLSDIGRALTNFNPLGAVTFDNEIKKESLFRNACGLLNVRQNVFTIIIEAQAASGGNIPRNPAKQRAVAIVWRDPYTGEMFIRHIKWLGD